MSVLITVLVTVLLYARVTFSEAPPANTPRTVATVAFQTQGQFTRVASFLGLVRAGRKANLGFEIPGLITSLPVRQGMPVKQGDTIGALDQSTLLSRRVATQAELRQVATELELAQLKAKRQRDLRATGAVSKEAFDETRLRAQALLSRSDAVAARLDSINIEINKTTLLAPYDGIVAEQYLHPGSVVNAGTPVVRLLEIANQEAHIGVPAARVHLLKMGGSYNLHLREQAFPAKLLTIRPDVDPLTRAATAVFALPPEVSALDGEPISLRLPEIVQERGGWLPIAALLEGKRGVWTVLTVKAQDDAYTTTREAVEVLDVQGDQAFVRGTVSSGALVVASGVHRISPGTMVAVQQER